MIRLTPFQFQFNGAVPPQSWKFITWTFQPSCKIALFLPLPKLLLYFISTTRRESPRFCFSPSFPVARIFSRPWKYEFARVPEAYSRLMAVDWRARKHYYYYAHASTSFGMTLLPDSCHCSSLMEIRATPYNLFIASLRVSTRYRSHAVTYDCNEGDAHEGMN